MERIIKVTGTGNVSAKPDITIITMEFSNIRPTYSESLKTSADDVSKIKDALERAGLDRNTLKTTHFSVDPHYESYTDKNNDHKSRLDGYEYNQTLRFKFPIDNKLLGKVLFEISSIDVFPKFWISYGLKDPETAKNALLEKAITDAKEKAQIIANTSKVQLDEILEINYSWIDIEMNTRPYALRKQTFLMYNSTVENRSFDVDFEPEDIERSDNVTVIFKIK